MLSYSTPFSGYSFAYDARNRQTEAFVGAIGTSWLINGLGQRIAQINVSVPEFFFVYDEAGHLTGKYDGGGNPLQETAWLGDLPVAVLSPAGRFYIAPDHLGAPHQITDAGGAVVWQWNQDPFGNGAPSGAFTYDLRFPGQFYDQGTRLHYNYFRDYDPRLGRYIESDPIGLAGGINTYAYARNNPLKYVDPSGEGFVDCVEKLAELAAATNNLARRIAEVIENRGNPDPGKHAKALQQALNRVNNDLATVKNSCACKVGAADAIAAAEVAIEAALLLLAPD